MCCVCMLVYINSGLLANYQNNVINPSQRVGHGIQNEIEFVFFIYIYILYS